MKEKLVKFIKDNNLKFTEGRRNSDCVIISGYALHLGVNDPNVIEKAIEFALDNTDDYYEELCRVLDYAQDHNYQEFWKKEEAKKLYKY